MFRRLIHSLTRPLINSLVGSGNGVAPPDGNDYQFQNQSLYDFQNGNSFEFNLPE